MQVVQTSCDLKHPLPVTPDQTETSQPFAPPPKVRDSTDTVSALQEYTRMEHSFRCCKCPTRFQSRSHFKLPETACPTHKISTTKAPVAATMQRLPLELLEKSWEWLPPNQLPWDKARSFEIWADPTLAVQLHHLLPRCDVQCNRRRGRRRRQYGHCSRTSALVCDQVLRFSTEL